MERRLMVARDSKFARGLALQSVAQFAQFGVTLALMPLIIKVAGAATYGSYVVLTSIITLVCTFLSLGAGFECRRTLPGIQERAARAAVFLPSMSFQLVTFSVSAVLLALALPSVNQRMFHATEVLHPATIVLAVLALFANNLADDFFRYTQQMGILSKAAVVRALAHPGLVLGVALLGHPLPVDRLILLQATSSLAISALLWWEMSRQISLRFQLQSWTAHRADIRVGFPLIAAVVVENLLSSGDRYVLALYLTPFEVGAYAAAFTVGSLVLLVPRVANSVLLPALSQAVDAGRTDEAEGRLRGFLQVFVMLALPFVAGAALLGRPILAWLADAAVAERAQWVVPLVAVAGSLYGYCYLLFNALFVSRETESWLHANVTAVVVALVLNLLLVGWLRTIEAAAVATLLSYAVRLVMVYRAGRSWSLRLNLPLIGRSALAAGGMTLVLLAGRAVPFGQEFLAARLLVLVGAGAAVYFLLLAWTGGYTPRQFRQALGV